MSSPIPDNFNDSQGRWVLNAEQQYDTTMPFDSTYSTPLADAEHKHIDLRGFFNTNISVPLTQAELDLLDQEAIEDDLGIYDIQQNLKSRIYAPGESWIHTGSGFLDPVVGTLPSRQNWRGLLTAATGSAINDAFYSGIAQTSSFSGYDISSMVDLSIIMPDMLPSDFDQAASSIQLTSNPTGQFDNAAYNSTAVTFDENTASGAELRLPLSLFADVNSFEKNKVFGIRIVLQKATSTLGEKFSIMGIRALGSGWEYFPNDFNTRIGAMTVPVTLDGNSPSDPPFTLIRGNGGGEDSKPSDASLLAYFNAGNTGFVRDEFSSNTMSEYAFVSGTASELVVDTSGLKMLSNSTQGNSYLLLRDKDAVRENGQTTVKFAGNHQNGSYNYAIDAVLKYISSSSDYILARVIDDGNSKLQLVVRANGIVNTYEELLDSRLTIGQPYWVRCRIDGDMAYAEFFTTEPLPTGAVAVKTASANLVSENHSEFVQYVEGYAGLQAQFADTSGAVQGLLIEPCPIPAATFNKLDLYFREQKDKDADTGSWLIARLSWNTTATAIQVLKESYDTGVFTQEAVATFNIPNLILQGSSDSDNNVGRYLFRGNLVGSAMNVELISTDSGLNLKQLLYTNVASSGDYDPGLVGRLGFKPDFYHRDASMDDLSATTKGYATMQSQTFPQRTPVDGAQLSASYSTDENLYRYFTWIKATERYVDKTKTASGKGSFRTTRGVFTNQFLLEEWVNTYIEFDIWVPATVTVDNQPVIKLLSTAPEIVIDLPALQPAQWNKIYIDLSEFADKPTGLFYYAVIVPKTPTIQLGQFWIDVNFRIGHRLVEWQMRASENAPWRSFRDMVNNPSGALHFPPNERGRDIQIRAIALTADAWISEYHLHPRHAQLGLPMYDKNAET